MSLGERVRYLIDKDGITAYEVSVKTGISQSTLSRVLNNSTLKLSVKNSDALAEYFHVHKSWLLTGNGEMLLKGGENPVSGLEKAGECERCKALEKDIEHYKQIIEAKDETIRAYQDNRDSKDENRHSA